ncbi:hypothetical protein AB0B48_03110 [Micromonospora sp. NPDC049089]|uniref:hypothetical protein n=1 Tax=Micromonospora sp. NPDC049089 TaxID=3155496 RepID=UPI0033F59A80
MTRLQVTGIIATGILSASIGVVTNVLTETPSLAWGVTLVTLVLFSISLSVGTRLLSERDRSSGVKDDRASPVATEPPTVSTLVSGKYNSVTTLIGDRHGIHAAGIALIIATTIGLLLTGFGLFVYFDRESPRSTASSLTGAPDPYHYVAFEGIHLSRKQDCDGLFGLCLGQPVSLAIEAFGREANGFPQSTQPNKFSKATQCHRWQPLRLDTVTICDANGSITSIELHSVAARDIAIAAPSDLIIRLPGSLDHAAKEITAAVGAEPFEASVVIGDGETLVSLAWFFPPPVSGSPDVKIGIVGRIPGFPEKMPTPCKGELTIYSFSDVLELSDNVALAGVEVSATVPDDFSKPKCSPQVVKCADQAFPLPPNTRATSAFCSDRYALVQVQGEVGVKGTETHLYQATSDGEWSFIVSGSTTHGRITCADLDSKGLDTYMVRSIFPQYDFLC